MSVERFLLNIDAHHIIVRRAITSEYDKDFLERLTEDELEGIYSKKYPNMKILSVTAFTCSSCPKELPLNMYGTDILYDIVIVPEKGKGLDEVINHFLQDLLAEDEVKGRGFDTKTTIYTSGNANYDRDYEMKKLKERCKEIM